jgi:hypothetical protein
MAMASGSTSTSQLGNNSSSQGGLSPIFYCSEVRYDCIGSIMPATMDSTGPILPARADHHWKTKAGISSRAGLHQGTAAQAARSAFRASSRIIFDAIGWPDYFFI